MWDHAYIAINLAEEMLSTVVLPTKKPVFWYVLFHEDSFSNLAAVLMNRRWNKVYKNEIPLMKNEKLWFKIKTSEDSWKVR